MLTRRGALMLLGSAFVSPAFAQESERSWYEGAWPIGGASVIVLRRETGQLVREARGQLRHGLEVPLTHPTPDSVAFSVSATQRYVIRRAGAEVQIEDWTLAPDGAGDRLLRTVTLPLR